jgi:hypothetical protein
LSIDTLPAAVLVASHSSLPADLPADTRAQEANIDVRALPELDPQPYASHGSCNEGALITESVTDDHDAEISLLLAV